LTNSLLRGYSWRVAKLLQIKLFMVNTTTNYSRMKLGLVCISEILKKKDKSLSFKTMTRKRFLELERQSALKELSARILHNCKLTKQIVLHCSANGISHYRISSCLAPLVTDDTLSISYDDLPDMEAISSALSEVGATAKSCGVSVSSHPDQFNVLTSYNQNVIDRSIKELNHQAYILDLMGLPQNYSAPMCLHLNLSPDFKKENLSDYVDRFVASLASCSQSVKNRLVLENEDKGFWNCKNLYESFGKIIPLVYDNLHDFCNQSSTDQNALIDLFKLTWGSYTPIMHWSEGMKDKPRSHAEFASHVPAVVSMNKDCVWEFELKGKDLAILQVLNNQ
jgi:UV DNA damage endonuclease